MRLQAKKGRKRNIIKPSDKEAHFMILFNHSHFQQSFVFSRIKEHILPSVVSNMQDALFFETCHGWDLLCQSKIYSSCLQMVFSLRHDFFSNLSVVSNILQIKNKNELNNHSYFQQSFFYCKE